VRQNQPIFNVPNSVLALISIFVIIHLLRQVLPAAEEEWWMIALAFVPARYAGYAAELPGGEIASVSSFITHMLVHADLTHLMFNSAWFLAFGGAIALRIGGARFLAFTAFTGIIGALTFLAFHFGALVPVIGASGAVSGMMGGVMRFMFSAIDHHQFSALREAPRSVPLMSLRQSLTDKRIIAVTVIWLLLNGLAVMGIPGVDTGGGIAWEAHLGGYAAGFFFFGFFDKQEPTGKPRLYLVN